MSKRTKKYTQRLIHFLGGSDSVDPNKAHALLTTVDAPVLKRATDKLDALHDDRDINTITGAAFAEWRQRILECIKEAHGGELGLALHHLSEDMSR